MRSLFENTYVHEITFSTMKQVKSKNRSRMSEKTLDDSLRLATINTGNASGIDEGTTVSEKHRPQASH